MRQQADKISGLARRSLPHLRQFVGRDLARRLDGHRFGRRGRRGWRRHRSGRRLCVRWRIDQSFSRVAGAVGDGGLDRFLGDRLLSGRLFFRIGGGLDGPIVLVVGVVIEFVIDALVDLRGVDVGRVREAVVDRTQQAAEHIGKLLAESGQATSDFRHSAE